jgi:hypothetical protein
MRPLVALTLALFPSIAADDVVVSYGARYTGPTFY